MLATTLALAADGQPAGALQGVAASAVTLTQTNHYRLPALRTNAVPGMPLLPRGTNQTNLAPGVYLSKPYTCIVVVPGQVDDGMLVPAPRVERRMPVIKPDLKLVPKK